MTTYNKELISIVNSSFNHCDLPLTPESGVITRTNSNCTQTSEDNPLKSLLDLDDTVLNAVEFNMNCINDCIAIKNVEDNKECSEDSSFEQVLNETRLFVDNVTQNLEGSIHIEWEDEFVENTDFKKYNTTINKELDDNINLLKSKLYRGYNETNISYIMTKTELNKSFNKNNISLYKYPFYGLPNKVKELIKKHKGIDKLYGKFLLVLM